MRIAQVSPLHESVPPKLYGGTERVVSYLTEELVAAGHDVTLFASGDSVTAAKLEPVVGHSLRLNSINDPHAYYMILLDKITACAGDFDIIHYHIDYLHYPFSRLLNLPHVTTLHGRLDLPVLQIVYQQFSDIPLISISDKQRDPLPNANWVATVYNGVPAKNYTFRPDAGQYLAFLGRISPEKGIEQAIEIAICSGMQLRIAAKVDKADEEYFRSRIKAKLQHPLIEFIGEINEQEKNDFLGHAYALLFPINWPEPFGLVMIEAMACGTPVIAYRCGSVPEVMHHGETGYIVNNINEAIEAVENIPTISRFCCRHMFEKRFSSASMAEAYVKAYQQLVEYSYQQQKAV